MTSKRSSRRDLCFLIRQMERENFRCQKGLKIFEITPHSALDHDLSIFDGMPYYLVVQLYFNNRQPCNTPFSKMTKFGIQIKFMTSYGQLSIKSRSTAEEFQWKCSPKRFVILMPSEPYKTSNIKATNSTLKGHGQPLNTLHLRTVTH